MTTYKILPNHMQLVEHYRAHYGASVPEGTTAEDLQRPEFWAHVARNLRPYDIIDVLPEDGSYFAEVIVLSQGVGFAKVKLLRFVELADDEVLEDEAPVIVKWKGPHLKHTVIRKSDAQVLKDGFPTKLDAENWAREYAQKIAA